MNGSGFFKFQIVWQTKLCECPSIQSTMGNGLSLAEVQLLRHIFMHVTHMDFSSIEDGSLGEAIFFQVKSNLVRSAKKANYII